MVRCLHVAFQFGTLIRGAIGCRVKQLCIAGNCSSRTVGPPQKNVFIAVGIGDGVCGFGPRGGSGANGDSRRIFVVRIVEPSIGLSGFDAAICVAGQATVCVGQLAECGRPGGGIGDMFLDVAGIHTGDVCQ